MSTTINFYKSYPNLSAQIVAIAVRTPTSPKFNDVFKRSTDERPYIYADCLASSFGWSTTPQGYEFWNCLYDALSPYDSTTSPTILNAYEFYSKHRHALKLNLNQVTL